MLLQRITYFLRESLRNLRTNPLVSGISTGIISLSILIFGLFLIVFLNFAGALDKWGRRMAVDVFLDKGVKAEQIEQISQTLKSLPEIDKITFVSADEAFAEFSKMLGPQAELLDELGENPLPASFRILPKSDYRTQVYLESLTKTIEMIDGVEEVRYGAKWVARFEAFINVLRVIGLVIGGILLLSSVLIISNTIRLTVFARSEEIEIMRLVGATETFIRVPFFLEGLFQGFIAGNVAVGLLWIIYRLMILKIMMSFSALGIGYFVFLPGWGIFALIMGGTLLGVLGSSVALSRFME